MAKKKTPLTFEELLRPVAERLQLPFGLVLGSPGEAARLAVSLDTDDLTAYQMDLFPAARLREALGEMGSRARVEVRPDLWDLPADFQTLIYPPALGGERELKIDMIEQAFHILRPGGILVVLSPYKGDDFFQAPLKKVFGRVHAPTVDRNIVFWCRREGDRPRRRHEITFTARVADSAALTFLSRPGTFAYGRFDDGSRAVVATMEIGPEERIVDIGCGCGTNGVFAALLAAGCHVTFIDSNLRAVALAEHNARAAGLTSFDTVASANLSGVAEGSYDVALANPPYFGQASVAGLFASRAHALLKPGGRLYLVTKQVHEVAPILEGVFGEMQAVQRGTYTIFVAEKKAVLPRPMSRGSVRG
jgi:16S rRNA (guanine1207-N2)-methyltransferase